LSDIVVGDIVTLVNHNVTSVPKKQKNLCERERRKPLVTLWSENIT